MPIKHRIMLVDDDREFSDLLCRRLLQRGYRVTELSHPRQALEAASLRDYDVVVLDRSLPEIDGLHLMQMLNQQVANLQIVFLSGRGDAEDENAALACGAFAYLTKPCRLAQIEATIERAIEHRCEQQAEPETHAVGWQPAGSS